MRKGFRKAGVACGTAFASVALALSTPAVGWAQNQALVVAGLGTSSMDDLVMAQILKDELHGMKRTSIWWPAEAAPYTGKEYSLGESINTGMANLNTEITAAIGRLVEGQTTAAGVPIHEKVTIVGLSAGSLVVTETLRQLAADPNAPDADDVTFIVVADSSRQKLIDKARYNNKYDYTYQPAPESQYDIKVVTGEYDGMADFPDRWWNFTAVMNAIAGGIFVHIPMMFTDLKEEDITSVVTNSKGGTVTNYLVKTAKLPLVQLMPWLAPREAELKAKVDKGYSRNDVVTTPAARSVASIAPTADEEETVTDTEVTEDVADTDDDAVDTGDGKGETGSAKDDVDEVEVVEEDTDSGSSKDDEAEADADAEEAEAAEASKDDEDSSDSGDSSDSDGSDSSGDSSSDESGSSDSGSSE